VSDNPLDQLDTVALIDTLRQKVSKTRFNIFLAKGLEIRGREAILNLIETEVLKPAVKESWGLWRSLTNQAGVAREAAERYPDAKLEWKSWLSLSFLQNVMSSEPELAGIRTALLGSLWMIVLTILIAVPLGIGAAIYLEEFSGKSALSKLIQVNIYNLAGVPSIIYGMLGLTIFVRGLEPLTSGQVFGITDSNGRTILSAAMTMALLILPLIIINTQEALRAVPRLLHEASYGIGMTKLETIWHHILPSALPGILTGTILAMSRAIGETAPLIVIGASTFIAFDPNGPFSKFTVLPIQIYTWTAQPNQAFRNIAAAAIVALLVLLVSLNLTAIVLRNRYRRD
jgi:phosphate transport system permease protein